MKPKFNLRRREFLIAILAVFSIIGVYYLGPAITSFVIKEFEYADSLNLLVTSSGEYTWNMQNPGSLRNARIDGSITNSGNARVYLEGNGNRYLILDTRSINESKEPPSIYFSTAGEEANTTGNSIDLRLDYNENSEYDRNNDGKESIYGIIDLSPARTKFNFDADDGNLCTRWEIINQNELTSTQVCYGSSNCCAYVSLAPKRSNWSEPYYASFGSDNAGYKNIISAQVIHTEFNATGDGLHSNTISGGWKSLNASFYEYYKEFLNSCEETCSLSGLNKTSYRLVFEIDDNATLQIDRIYYDVDADIAENNPPLLVKSLPNITIESGKTAEINLTYYFADGDNEELEYFYYRSDGIKIEFDKNTAILKAESGFYGLVPTFITANDTKDTAISNLFNINITEAPEQPKKFAVANPEGEIIFEIDEFGNAHIAGEIFENLEEITPTKNSFVIQDAEGLNVAYINSSGSVFLRGNIREFSPLESGDLKLEIRNEDDELVAFFDETGNLEIKGEINAD